MKVNLVSITAPLVFKVTTPEELIMYCARVSSTNQISNDVSLLKYLIEHKHWSPFEMVDITVEIVTSRAISPQLLRHRSFSFQEFSLRYAKATEFEDVELRLQGATKQGSGDVHPDYSLNGQVMEYVEMGEKLYQKLTNRKVSRETARMILPLCTQTKLYMKGSVRSWIHYLQIRLADDTQKEHRLIAEQVKSIFKKQFPIVSEVIEW